jgi:hypothetical protein
VLHRDLIASEKKSFYKARVKARSSTTSGGVKVRKHMSIIIDGMDQGKSAIPSPARMDKSLDSCMQLTTHIMGVLDHGGGTPCQLYVSDPSVPSDVNMVITILLMVISLAASAAPLPPTLYVQLDGAGENKCRWLLLMLGILVALGVFMKIKLSFLPVGHTHEDIDQLFSRLAAILKEFDILTMNELMARMRSSARFEGQYPLVNRLLTTFDFKGWMDPSVMPSPFRGITEPMCFKFIKSPCGRNVNLFARLLMSESKKTKPDCWFPEDGYKLLDVSAAEKLVDVDIMVIPPRANDITGLRSTVDKYVKEGAMDVGQQTMWEVELDRMQRVVDEACPTCAALRVREAATNKVKTDTRQEINAKDTARRIVSKELQQHLTAERETPEPSPGHTSVTIRSLLGAAIPEVNEVALEEKELVQPPPLPVAKSRRPKDVRKLVVGKVPVHMRIILKPPAANEFIFFRYCDKQDAADHVPAEETQHLGVGLVMKVLPDECYKIAWYGHDRYQDPVTALQGAYKQMWVRPVPVRHKSRRKGRKKKAVVDEDGHNATEHYYSDKKWSPAHWALTETIKIGKHEYVGQAKSLNKTGHLPLKTKRKICAVKGLPHKIKDHAEDCTCINS